MTIKRLPNVPTLVSTNPEINQLLRYLTALVSQLQSELNSMDQTKQDIALPVKFPLTQTSLLEAGGILRNGDSPSIVMVNDFSGDFALIVADGAGKLRSVTIGPPID